MSDDREGVRFPLSIRFIPPRVNAVHLTGITPSGSPSGVHTGGALLWNQEVWKPLDARPFANCEYHVPTREAELLEIMADLPGFPRNWRVVQRNGRRWLVRPCAHILTQADSLNLLRTELLEIEQSIRTLNRRHWEIGDEIALARDLQTGTLFLYNLSNAHPQKGSGAYAADEEWRINQLFEWCSVDALKLLRQHARHVLSEIAFWEHRHAGYVHVYAAFDKPFFSILELPCETVLVQSNPSVDQAKGQPWTWVVSKIPLEPSIANLFGLERGWSPLRAE